MTTISVLQIPIDSDNGADWQVTLHDAIQQQVCKSRFSRRRFDEEEIVNEVFVRLVNKIPHPSGSDRFYGTISRCIRHTLRDYMLADKPALDVDELAPDEHPFYTMDAEWEDAEFEDVFRKFCESYKEPKRKVYSLSRLYNVSEIARIAALSRRTVSKLLKEMHDDFRQFLKKSSPRAH